MNFSMDFVNYTSCSIDQSKIYAYIGSYPSTVWGFMLIAFGLFALFLILRNLEVNHYVSEFLMIASWFCLGASIFLMLPLQYPEHIADISKYAELGIIFTIGVVVSVFIYRKYKKNSINIGGNK